MADMPSSLPRKRLVDIVGGVFEPPGVGNVGVWGRSKLSMVSGAVVSFGMVRKLLGSDWEQGRLLLSRPMGIAVNHPGDVEVKFG